MATTCRHATGPDKRGVGHLPATGRRDAGTGSRPGSSRQVPTKPAIVWFMPT
jgi:hypothetical protein